MSHSHTSDIDLVRGMNPTRSSIRGPDATTASQLMTTQANGRNNDDDGDNNNMCILNPNDQARNHEPQHQDRQRLLSGNEDSDSCGSSSSDSDQDRTFTRIASTDDNHFRSRLHPIRAPGTTTSIDAASGTEIPETGTGERSRLLSWQYLEDASIEAYVMTSPTLLTPSSSSSSRIMLPVAPSVVEAAMTTDTFTTGTGTPQTMTTTTQIQAVVTQPSGNVTRRDTTTTIISGIDHEDLRHRQQEHNNTFRSSSSTSRYSSDRHRSRSTDTTTLAATINADHDEEDENDTVFVRMELSERDWFHPVLRNDEVDSSQSGLVQNESCENNNGPTGNMYNCSNDRISVDSAKTMASIAPAATSTLSILQQRGILHQQFIETMAKRRVSDGNVMEAHILQYLFQDFATPILPFSTAQKLILMEQDQIDSPSSKTTTTGVSRPIRVDLPDPISIQLPPPTRSREPNKTMPNHVLTLLASDTITLFELPINFAAAFLRTLIRFITLETDDEYDNNCWRRGPPRISPDTRIDPILPPPEHPDHSTRRPHILYNSVRMQCPLIMKDRPAIILLLWERALDEPGRHGLLFPLSRLLGLWTAAGVTPRTLRRMIYWAQGGPYNTLPSSAITTTSSGHSGIITVPPSARLGMVLALQTAAVASISRRMIGVQKTPPLHFFAFGGLVPEEPRSSAAILDGSRKHRDDDRTDMKHSGLGRTIHGLATWPFRNDFSMALWFRVEYLPPIKRGNPGDDPVLVSVRSDGGGGIDVSLLRIERNSPAACTLAVSIYDSHPHNPPRRVHHLKVGGCVLLTRVWYHLCIRHTRSRLKGVFSLSTRQNISIMLDGKVMLTESLPFPKVSEADFREDSTSILPTTLRRHVSAPTRINVTIRLGQGLNGETGTLYLFHDSVPDATFRTMYEITGGNRGGERRRVRTADVWDAKRSSIVRKSRVLEAPSLLDYSEEYGMGGGTKYVGKNGNLSASRQRAKRRLLPDKLLSVMDMGGESEETDDHENLSAVLQKGTFSSKVFLVWDPRRVIEAVAVDLHMGAHAKMVNVYSWSVQSVQEVVGSLGGMQTLIPLFRSFISNHREWNVVDLDKVGDALESNPMSQAIPILLDTLSAFIKDNSENARELLRCGGIDVIADFLTAGKRSTAGKRLNGSVLVFISSSRALSIRMLESLLRLEFACSHNLSLVTKVFSRLLFNIPLWFDGRLRNDILSVVLLPVLSLLTRTNPDRVRDCVKTRDIVQALQSLFDSPALQNQDSAGFISAQLMSAEILLGMIFTLLHSKATADSLSPFLDFISGGLDKLLINGNNNILSLDVRRSELKREVLLGACSTFYFLLQLKPVNVDFYESFVQCCGSVQDGAGWILCSMVNVSDDEIRALGVRAVSSYLEATSNGPDAVLMFGTMLSHNRDATEVVNTSDVVATNVIRASSRIGQLAAKGLAAMGPTSAKTALAPSKLTARVVYKLLWHFLKSRRYHLSEYTRTALLSIVTDDNDVHSESLASYEFLKDNLVVPTGTTQPGYRLSLAWARNALSQTGEILGKSLRNPLATGTIVRLLRYLEEREMDKWLKDLLTMTKSGRKSVSLISSLPDWEPCMFQLVSDILEQVRSLSSDGLLKPYGDTQEVSGQAGVFSTPDTRSAKDSREVALSSALERLDICLDLFATCLGHLLRSGGEKVLESVEKTASLQRTCVNGTDVLLMIFSRLCADLFDHGTILEIGSISAEDWKDVDIEHDSPALKQSARLITDAILSPQSSKGLDMPTAVRSWRSLRHLMEVIVALVIKSGLGVVDLFDYSKHRASSVDAISSGLHGIRLPDGRIGGITSKEYSILSKRRDGKLPYLVGLSSRELNRDVDRRLCVTLVAQILVLLDAFIFPDTLETSMPTSQLHGLALVRHSEARLGSSQGPLILSAMRLSFLLLAVLEPCSVKFLQCASRLRCLIGWSLELIRESSTDGPTSAFHPSIAHIDRLLLAAVLHCHRALGRSAAVLSEIDSSPYDKYFYCRETQKKHQRRLLRAALELRDIVSTTFRGRNDLLMASLSCEAFEALRTSLEGSLTKENTKSKESVVRDFLVSNWVVCFQDVETRGEYIIPEQVSMDDIPLNSEEAEASIQGCMVIEKLAQECLDIVSDFERALDLCFQQYLEGQRKWTETDAVRELEYEGDTVLSRLSDKLKSDMMLVAKESAVRKAAAESKYQFIERQILYPWKDQAHWMIPTYADRLGRRLVLVPNDGFESHADACYDLSLGEQGGNGWSKDEGQVQGKKDISDVIRKYAGAFNPSDGFPEDSVNEEENYVNQLSDGDSSIDFEAKSDHPPELDEASANILPDVDDSWDKISSEEVDDFDTSGDVWAKAFTWSDGDTPVAHFEPVILVELQTYVEGRLLLSTHALCFLQTSPEVNIMTNETHAIGDNTGYESKGRRWRLGRLTEIHGRRYMLRPQAVELFFADCDELFIAFPSGTKERDRFHSKLRNSCKVPMLSSPKSLNPRTVFRKSKIVELWRKRKVSNFEYLMAVNRMAGRSFNDLTQYPVFPWVIADYTSDSIDLCDSRVYRDLSKPIGALNPDRLAQFLERYNDLDLFGFSDAEKFLYGSHYSSPGIVLHFLIRQEPFTSMAIQLQSGRFDCPDRLFFDMVASWNSCMTSTSDTKELIPEFFYLPELFMNTNKFPLGRTQCGRLVDNVGLPPWAKGSAYEFVRINRLALESEYVSQNLHHWIDLIFGYKQRGLEAEKAHNLFHHLSYEGSVDLEKIADEVDRKATESHIQNFGQTPSQLSPVDPHPARFSQYDCWRPLITDSSSAGRLRCYTPAKQFANKRSEYAKGAVIKLLVLSDSVLAVYEDMSVGTYRWFPNCKTNRLRMDRIRPLPRREVSVSRYAVKKGSEIPLDECPCSAHRVGNGLFAISILGAGRDEHRRKTGIPSNILIPSSENSQPTTESSVLIVSCGYWDETVKLHAADSMRLVGSERGGHRGPIRCVSIGDDGGLMVTGGQDGKVCVWVVDRPDLAMALSDAYTQASLEASTDGDQVIACCRVLVGHDSPITCLAMNSELDVAASGDATGRICIHKVRRGEYIRGIQPHTILKSSVTEPGAAVKIVLGSNGILVVHMHDQGLHTYSVNGVRLCTVNAGEILNDIAMCAGDQMIVTGGDRCEVLVRSVMNLQVCSMLDLSRHGPIRCIGLTPDYLNPTEQFLYVGSDDGMITIVDQDPLNQHKDSDTIAF